MQDHRIRQLGREENRRRSLGSEAACFRCGITDPPSLMKRHRSLLDRHHVAGRVSDANLMVIVCRNCHAILTEGQRNVGADLSHTDRHPLDLIITGLLSLAAFFRDLANTFGKWADTLIRHIAALDEKFPQWRGTTP